MLVRIKDALVEAKTRLAGASASAGLDADVLIQHCLGKDAGWVIAHGDEPLCSKENNRFMECVERRLKGEPVAYIIGQKEFWSLNLALNRSVLIPRPETEHLVEQALRRIPATGTPRVLDLGTGSGAVALAIAQERPLARVTATDISSDILEVAADNAVRLGVRNVQFMLSDWFDGLNGCTFDVIVSNPPYVADADPCLREPEIGYEPLKALRAGPRGLDALSVIAAGVKTCLDPSGWLLVEHGCGQEHEVTSLLGRYALTAIACYPDHAGRPRVTECRAASRPT